MRPGTTAGITSHLINAFTSIAHPVINKIELAFLEKKKRLVDRLKHTNNE